MENQKQTLKVRVLTKNSQSRQKENGGLYVLQNCIVTEEGHPLEGKTIPGIRTILNKNGEEKLPLEPQTDAIVYMSIVPTKDGKGLKPFFELAEASNNDEEILAALGITVDENSVAMFAEQQKQRMAEYQAETAM